jgi:hypothetical protein
LLNHTEVWSKLNALITDFVARRIRPSWLAMSDLAVPVPTPLVAGVPMLKISSKKMKQVIMRLDDGCITWAGSSNSKG